MAGFPFRNENRGGAEIYTAGVNPEWPEPR